MKRKYEICKDCNSVKEFDGREYTCWKCKQKSTV